MCNPEYGWCTATVLIRRRVHSQSTPDDRQAPGQSTWRRIAVVALTAGLLLPLPSAAQSPARVTELRGTITAAGTGSPVSGARITIDDAVHREATSDADGRFAIRDLPSGSAHDVMVAADGFRPWSRRKVVVTPDAPALDVVLEIKGVTETVSVSAQASAIDRRPAAAAKVDAPLRDLPQAINVVPASVFREQGARSMEDVLRNVPGIGYGHGDGQRDQVTIRGFTAISDQYLDGMRDDSLYFRDLANIERVEVLKGPASALYGRGSSGGLINRVTKKPTDRTIRELNVTLGSFDQRRLSADLGAPVNDRIRVRLNAAYENSDGYRDEYFLERYIVAPSVSFAVTPQTDLVLQVDHLSDRRLTDFGIPAVDGRPVDVPYGTYYGSANGRDDTTRALVTGTQATFEHRFRRATLRNAFRFYDYDLNRRNTLVSAVVGGEAVRTRGIVRRQEDGLFNQTELSTEARWLGARHQLLTGVEIARQQKDQVFMNVANIDRVPLFAPAGHRVPDVPASARPGTDNVGFLDTSGAYVQDLVSLGAHWKSLVGLRFDEFKQRTEERRPGQPNLERTDRAVSPRVGVVYQPQTWSALYASVGKSFQPSGESFPLAASNAALKPEETRNYEVGAKYDLLGGAVSTTASVFQLRRTNIKTTDPAAPSKLIPIGEQRTSGFEWTVDGRLGTEWLLSAGYAYLDADITRSTALSNGVPLQGKRPSLTPAHSGNLWVRRQLGSGFAVAGGVRAMGRRFAAPDDLVTLPAYALVDSAVFYNAKAFAVALNVGNLLDRRYMVSAHGSSNHLNLPGAPRNLQLSLRTHF